MRRAAAMTLALAALAAGGCGGDDSDDLDKSGVIEEGDRLCQRYRDKSGPITRRVRNSSDPSAVAGVLRELTSEATSVAEDFDDLVKRAPSGDRAQLRDYVSTSREQIRLLGRAADLLERRRTARARAVIRSGQETAVEQRRKAQRYGFKVCGSGTS